MLLPRVLLMLLLLLPVCLCCSVAGTAVVVGRSGYIRLAGIDL